MMKQRLPSYVGMTLKELKKEKRHEFKELLKIMNKFNFGGGFMPPDVYDSFRKIWREIETMKPVLQKWWRGA